MGGGLSRWPCIHSMTSVSGLPRKRDFVADRRDQLAAEREAAEGRGRCDGRRTGIGVGQTGNGGFDARAAELGIPGDARATAAAQLVDAGADAERAPADHPACRTQRECCRACS